MYKRLKEQGYKFITKDVIGGECAHKVKPRYRDGYWFSPGWHYVFGGWVCKNSKQLLTIDEAIAVPKPAKKTIIRYSGEEDICGYCGEVYIKKVAQQHYCCKRCANAAAEARRKERLACQK